MGAKIARVLKSLIKWIGFVAAYFADVPAFLRWIADTIAMLLTHAAHEPIGSAAATDGRPMIAPPTPSAIASAPTRPTEFVERVKGANNH